MRTESRFYSLGENIPLYKLISLNVKKIFFLYKIYRGFHHNMHLWLIF